LNERVCGRGVCWEVQRVSGVWGVAGERVREGREIDGTVHVCTVQVMYRMGCGLDTPPP
jgi:hypothetical protein